MFAKTALFRWLLRWKLHDTCKLQENFNQTRMRFHEPIKEENGKKKLAYVRNEIPTRRTRNKDLFIEMKTVFQLIIIKIIVVVAVVRLQFRSAWKDHILGIELELACNWG